MASKHGNLAVKQNALPVSSMLPVKDAALFDDMIEKWATHRLYTLKHTNKSVDASVSAVKDMLSHVGKAPWHWTEEDFDSWCHHIGVERGVVPGTQRNYQTAIRRFMKYIVENLKYRNIVLRDYGIELRQIITLDNCLPHVNENEKSTERPALTHDQIQTLFDSIDLGIKEAAKFRSKDARPLQRDKVLFYLKYTGGLRISEVLGLNVNSFKPNPQFPQFGKYGVIHVWGKGSKGSGPKLRIVYITHPDLPKLLDWYVKKIYPEFMVNADANETALFLSERGNRLAVSTAEYRFQHALDLAGLDGQGFTPHSLRHSSVTHESLRFSLEANRRQHGHVYGSTTQRYTHIPEEMVVDEINRAIKSQLDQIAGKRKKGGKK